MERGFPDDNDDIEEFFERMLRGFDRGGRTSGTYYDVLEMDGKTTIIADMPGLDSEENIDVKVKGKQVDIVGANSRNSYRLRDSFGFEIDDYTVQYNNGVLKVQFEEE